MNLLNSNEAFSALMAGKNIMCRAVGELMDFDDLNQFPATIFALPGYEFCIKRESLTLADIQFTKPVEPHDLENGQEIFIVMPTCILRTKYDPEHGDICLSVANGFAQLDAENAQLQLQAFGKTFGNMITEIEIKDGFSEKPKKTRTPRKVKETEIKDGQSSGIYPKSQVKSQAFIDLWLNRAKDEPSQKNLVNLKASIDHNFNLLDDDHKVQAQKIYEDFKLLVEDLDTSMDPEQYAPKLTNLDHQIYLDGINSCESEKEIEIILRDVDAQGFSEAQLDEINNAKQCKLTEFTLSLKEPALTLKESAQYEILLNDLVNRAQEAKTSTEANALIVYTKSWTEEQRKPLMNAINKRLSELGATAPPPEQPQSLVVQIQNAPDLTALDILEIDVATRHPDIQPKLMGLVRKRRFELENSSSMVVQS